MPTMTELDARGFVFVEQAVDELTIAGLRREVEKLRAGNVGTPGLRMLLKNSPAILRFAETKGRALAEEASGQNCFPVRGILFDKNVEANWYIRWHQDRTIAVKEKIESAGFKAWSVKDDVHHVHPPAQVLESMVCVRIHLDNCGIDNGAIEFIPRSHANGLMEAEETARWRDSGEHVAVPCLAGDAIVMRPLVMHSSARANSPAQRRIIHIEYATAALPHGLQWATS